MSGWDDLNIVRPDGSDHVRLTYDMEFALRWTTNPRFFKAVSVPSFVPPSRPESTGAGRTPPQQPYSVVLHRRLAAIPVCGTNSHLGPILSVNRAFSFELYPHSYPQVASSVSRRAGFLDRYRFRPKGRTRPSDSRNVPTADERCRLGVRIRFAAA
jgi:hypothetical protein